MRAQLTPILCDRRAARVIIKRERTKHNNLNFEFQTGWGIARPVMTGRDARVSSPLIQCKSNRAYECLDMAH